MNRIDGPAFQKMLVSGANHLANHKAEVDALNIFPVPDGDTGTNMSLTLSAVAARLLDQEDTSLAAVASTLAEASLRGARGNSGVITSQICRGISKVVREREELTSEVFALALKEGADTAYKAIMSPTEGTILTVIRGAADFALTVFSEYPEMELFLEKVIQAGNDTLAKTPEMLPVLKSAGVVDAGGKGLMTFLEGAYAFLKDGEVIQKQEEDAPVKTAVLKENIRPEDIKFAYCTEFIIHLKSDVKVDRLKQAFSSIGDSLVLVEDDGVIKVHVHSNTPDIALGIALKHGDLSGIKIDNMKMQAQQRIDIQVAPAEEGAEKKPYGFVCVSMGDGLNSMFQELGVDAVIKGGQTMNPSTEDILRAVDAVSSDTVFILPNNKNIIPAAQQVKELSDKTIYVVPTKTITQAVSCLLNLDYDAQPDEMFQNMQETIRHLKPASVTYAARDSKMDGKKIKKGDILGLADGKIQFAGKDPGKVAALLVGAMVKEDSSLVSLFYGEGVTQEDAQALQEKLEASYPDCDVSVYHGGQPLYYYFISVE